MCEDKLYYCPKFKTAKREVFDSNGCLSFVVNYNNMSLEDAKEFAQKYTTDLIIEEN